LLKIKPDLIVAGRQAIDGDTAQVGPQVAEKLGWPQVTYVENIEKITDKEIVLKRRLERGVETVSCPLPMVFTVNSSASDCRMANAKRVMKYKYAKTPGELQELQSDYISSMCAARDYLRIAEWGVSDIECREEELGLQGSPTKVKKIENVVLQAKESKKLTASDADINELMVELIASHTLG